MSFKAALESFGNYPEWKKVVSILLLFMPIILMAAMFTWLISMPGSLGMVRVMLIIRVVLYALGAFALVTSIVALLLFVVLKSRPPDGRRWVRITVGTCLGLVIGAGILLPSGIYTFFKVTASVRSGDKPPQLLMVSGTGARGTPDLAVTFWTREPSISTFTWGDGHTETTLADEEEARSHVFVMDDLEPGQEYWYRIDNGRVQHYRALPADGTIRFAAGGDAHFGAGNSRNDITRKILGNIADPENGFDALFLLGDLVELGFVDADWEEALTSISPFTSVIPTRPLPGNHDMLLTGYRKYREYLYPEGMPVNSGSREWYRIDAGDIHFFLLDFEWGLDSYTVEQREWFESELASVPQDSWKIVMSHCMFFSSGLRIDGWDWYDRPDILATFPPLFEEHNVQLVLNGHKHQLELLEHNGVTYCIGAGLGGAS